MQDIDVNKKIDNLKWSANVRLSFIEARLYWDGQINRSTLTGKFDISVPQASADIAQYSGLASENIRYDKVKKTYVATDIFTPIFYRPSSEEYFAQLKANGQKELKISESISSFWPDYIAFSVPQRLVQPSLLRAIINAIKTKKMMEVLYESYSQDEISWRWISPHAIAFANDRWVLRGFCHKKNLFRDFVISRIAEIKKFEPSDIDPAIDANWHSVEIIVFEPNPALLPTQRKVVEHDYSMEDGKLKLLVRRCLLYYLYHNLGFHKPEAADCRPDAMDKLVLVNRTKIESIIFEEQNLNYQYE